MDAISRQRESPRRSRPPRLPTRWRVPAWMPARRSLLVAVTAFAVAAVACVALFALHRRSENRADALLLLGRVAADVQRLHAAGQQGNDDGTHDAATHQVVIDARRRLDGAFVALRALDGDRLRLDTLELQTEAFLSAVSASSRLMSAGDTESARRVGRERVRPALEALDQRLASLREAYVSDAAAADRLVLAAAAALIFLTGGAVVQLRWRHDAARRDAARIALQERVLRENEVRFRSLVQHSSDVISVADADWRVVYSSPATLPRLGFGAEEVEGIRLLDLVHQEDYEKAERFAADVAAAPGESRTVVWRLRHASGAFLDAETVATNLLADPVVSGIVINTRDVSERVALETRLTHQASHDALTNLANRALFRVRLEKAVERFAGQEQGPVVLFLDLDDFKAVNDTLGHDQGDKLLTEAAERFLSATRGRDLVARFGGDEFAILLENVRDIRGAVRVAERVAAALREPFRVGGREHHVSASVGIAATEPGMSADELLRNADVAMYAAKNRGKGRFEVYHAEMHAALLGRAELEGDLRAAVERGDIEVAYLPLIDLETGALRGVEALARWQHPLRGPVTPSVFVPIAEETGVIVPLGRHVLETACRQVALWQLAMGGAAIAVHVNVSPRQLLHAGFVESVREVLATSGVAPGSLALELTEASLFHGSDVLLERLDQLRALGISVVLDDFGTGYASLGGIERFHVDTIKVDRTFVDRVASGGVPGALAAAVLSFGRALGLRTVAEGVETLEQAQRLQTLGCDDAQGFYFSRPLDPAAMSAWLLDRRGAAAGQPEPVGVE